MSSDFAFLAGQASIWALIDGPNTAPQYLGCHGIGDITEPRGDVTLKYCPDPAASGKYMVKNSFRGEPGAITTSIETDMGKTADYLEEIGNCAVAIFVHKVSCGRRDVFTNFDRTFILRYADVTQASIGNVASRSPDAEEETMQTFDMSARALTRIYDLTAYRVAVTETEDITGIAICGEQRCEGPCGASQDEDDLMFFSTKALVGSALNVAEVWYSANGSVWAATAADPFAAGEDIQGIVCFKVGGDVTRVLVARGTTDAGVAAEVAYSDDNGDNWTPVDVGAANGEFVSNGHALFALDLYHIWLGTDGGRIYFSNDGGLTWTLQENAVISGTDIVGISFVSANVGFAAYTGGEIAQTTDGSQSPATWSATTVSGSGALTDIHAISQYFVWAVGTDGKFYTHDAGTTWATRDTVPTGAVDFLDDLVGLVVGSAASGVIYMTIDGGFDWSPLPAIANSGMVDVKMITPKLSYVAGNIDAATGFLAKVTPTP